MSDRRIVALHEASHAVCAALLGRDVEIVSIRPGEHFLGVTLVSGGEEIEDLANIRGRRRGGTLLARHGLIPTPLFDPEQLRRATVTIMVHLAGPLGEMFSPPTTSSGYVVSAADDDVAAAGKVATSLTERQQRHLVAVEAQDFLATDADVVADTERQIAGDEAAGQLVAWIAAETRRLVASALFRDLALPIAEQLLAHDVIGGQVVHDAIAAKTPRQFEGLRAAARRKNEEET